ncbi:P-loop containing nucleoside triphosphate hydrolase protein [Mucor mucedo]|uniref:P-loop containing nucleoside triphosphate hydrolase protein n=1 Tax=Mucor mucedo TaxID=29922 RepID=UPI00221EEFB3|nr:P-loop containing nucleoside triphosphate hydrolase protein [Mucor mucedo]KAI7873353.1 P-loop containing nucleoside triphosphate hydrolase protein [Mucor mucedo]
MAPRQRTISTSSNNSSVSTLSGKIVSPRTPPRTPPISENVQVTVRCRPPKKDELNNCWDLNEPNKITSIDPKLKKQHQFNFDNVFYGSDNASLYSKSVEKLINQAMEGYNATVFAYGQTASGKTFTMGTETEPGVIPRSVENVFAFIKKAITREFLLRVSYIEIYNETIRDLLNPSNDNFRISKDSVRGVYVSPLTEEVVTCPQDVMKMIQRGEANRHISSTDYNLHSSRSHTIFQMIIESRERNSTSTATIHHRRTLTQSGYGTKSKETVKISQLNLIDLAGSEKAATNEERRKEGAFINKSLLTLGTVISKLTEASNRSHHGPKPHIPYRDSKLTRILETALSGMAKVAVLCTMSPSLQALEESVNTLKFATRVKKITIHAKNDEVMDDKALIQKYRVEIEQLKSKLKEQELNSLAVSERRDHEQKIKQMLNVRDTLKERIDQLTKLILTSASVVIQQKNEDDELIITEAHTDNEIKNGKNDDIKNAVIYQLEQKVKKLVAESHEKDDRIKYLEQQLRVQAAVSSRLETELSITKAELGVSQLTPAFEKKSYLGSPPQERAERLF